MFEYPGFLEVSRCFQNVFPPWSFLLHVVAITIQLLADYTDTMVHYLTLSSQVRMDWMILFDVVPWQGMKRRWAHQTVWYLAYLLYNIYIYIYVSYLFTIYLFIYFQPVSVEHLKNLANASNSLRSFLASNSQLGGSSAWLDSRAAERRSVNHPGNVKP